MHSGRASGSTENLLARHVAIRDLERANPREADLGVFCHVGHFGQAPSERLAREERHRRGKLQQAQIGGPIAIEARIDHQELLMRCDARFYMLDEGREIPGSDYDADRGELAGEHGARISAHRPRWLRGQERDTGAIDRPMDLDVVAQVIQLVEWELVREDVGVVETERLGLVGL